MKSLPASVRKLDEISSESDNSSSEEYSEGPNGFRLVDISVLSAVFHLLCCPVSKHGRVELQEDSGAKMGFASLFVLKCENQKCKFFEKFYSSSKIEGSQAFEVNMRIVLATRNIGIGHQALAKFACVMNMPPTLWLKSPHWGASINVCMYACMYVMKILTGPCCCCEECCTGCL